MRGEMGNKRIKVLRRMAVLEIGALQTEAFHQNSEITGQCLSWLYWDKVYHTAHPLVALRFSAQVWKRREV